MCIPPITYFVQTLHTQLIDKYGVLQCLDPRSVKFMFDGNILGPAQTPEGLGANPKPSPRRSLSL